MMDDAELVRQLREPTFERGLDEKWIDAQRNCAADRIEALIAERDRFAERHERHLVLGAEVRARAEKAEAERDAARDAALEEAAEVARNMNNGETAKAIAAAIRALKGKSQ